MQRIPDRTATDMTDKGGRPTAPMAPMQTVLDALDALGPLPLQTLLPRQARELPSFAEAVRRIQATRGLAPDPELDGGIVHRVIPGGPGSEGTLVRVYTPPAGSGPFPVLVYFHGGGWVIYNLDVYDASCRALAAAAGCLVVSVAYRQAPEHPFPAAVDDAYAAFEWVCLNAAAFDGDPNRVAVGGESAGGNLAAVTAMLARDHGPALPVHQVLVYPVTDMVNLYPSYAEFVDAKPLATRQVQWFGQYYAPEGVDRGEARLSPLLAPDVRGLPPATVIAAEIDPLRDQVLAYAGRLQQAGVPVTVQRYPGVTHEFFGMGAVLEEARSAVALAAAGLRASFAGAAGPLP